MLCAQSTYVTGLPNQTLLYMLNITLIIIIVNYIILLKVIFPVVYERFIGSMKRNWLCFNSGQMFFYKLIIGPCWYYFGKLDVLSLRTDIRIVVDGLNIKRSWQGGIVNAGWED
jgi:hypothetical protein